MLVSEEDLALLEKIEGQIDNQEADRILAEMKTKDEKPIPWEKVKRDLADRDDLASARKALKSFKRSESKGTPLEEVARELGIELPQKRA